MPDFPDGLVAEVRNHLDNNPDTPPETARLLKRVATELENIDSSGSQSNRQNLGHHALKLLFEFAPEIADYIKELLH